jgi:hypothetical protein
VLNTGETLLMLFLVPIHGLVLSIPVWVLYVLIVPFEPPPFLILGVFVILCLPGAYLSAFELQLLKKWLGKSSQ